MSEDLPLMQSKARNFFARLHTHEPPIRLRLNGKALESGEIDAAQREKRFRQQLAEKAQQLRGAEEALAVTKSKFEAVSDSESYLQSEVARLTEVLKASEEEVAVKRAAVSKQAAIEKGKQGEGGGRHGNTGEEASAEIGVLRGEMVLKEEEISRLETTIVDLRQEHAAEREARPQTPTSEPAKNTAAVPAPKEAPPEEIATPSNAPALMVDMATMEALRSEKDNLLRKAKEEATKHENEISRLKEENARLLREQSLGGEFAAGSRMQELNQRLWHTTQPVRSEKPCYKLMLYDEAGREVEPELLSDQDWHREQQIKRYYESRAAQMHKRLQLADKIAMR